MDRKPPFDPSLFIPIGIAACSIFGIVLVLLGLRVSAARGTIQTIITNTPVRFQYLGTEPVVPLPTDSVPVEEEILAATETETFLLPPTSTQPSITQPFATTAPAPRTATVTVTAQALGTTYDDADPVLIYAGNWIPQGGVNGAYNSTLHISSTIGDAVQLVFYGEKIRVVYQAGPSLGVVAIKLDISEYVLDQSAAETRLSEWESPVQPLANHTITITHISGGSINIDSLVVVDLSTPTPTATPTPTP